MIRKNVRFNYFSINLTPEEVPDNLAGRNINNPWDMTEILDYLVVQRNILNCVINVGEYIADFERETLIYDQRANLYSFQLGKMRATGIPSLKRMGQPKEDLQLNDDEYIGEFVTIIFDPTVCSIAVQSNKYSLNVNQVSMYLTELRRQYNSLISRVDAVPMKVNLAAILDTDRVRTIGNADIFRKITIKGTDVMLDALAQNGVLGEVSELVGRAEGLNFEVSISLGRAPRCESLDADVVQEIIEGFNQIDENQKPKIEITAREDEDAALEVVNLMAPTLSNFVVLYVEERRGIGHQYIHDKFVENYTHPRGRIRNANRPLE